MSMVNQVVESVKRDMEKYAVQYRMDAKKRAEARDVPPATEQEMGWAIDSEYNSIQSELVTEEVKEKWTGLFTTAIDQANSSYDTLFVESMVAALQHTHKAIQSEFWLRMLSVMAEVSGMDACQFDPRNMWVKDVLSRMLWAKDHPSEMDAVTRMDENQLRKLRLSN